MPLSPCVLGDVDESMLAAATTGELGDVRPRPVGSSGLISPAAAPRVRRRRDGGDDPAVAVGTAAVVLAVPTLSVVVLLLHHQQQQLLPNELQRSIRRLRHVFPLAGYR